MLLSGRCEVFGIEEDGDPSFVVRDTEDVLISVVGRPGRDAIEEAVARGWEGDVLITPPENEAYVSAALPGWKAVSATLHLLGDTPRLPPVPAGTVCLFDPPELTAMDWLPLDLLAEFRVSYSPIAASLADGRPVSFCYAAARTEGLWDISINTLEGFRNQGYAARCVAFMVERMESRGLRPVWGAEEWNRASLGLAAKLGFVPVDSLLVFRPTPNC